ncbi:putative UPF0481 protein At3g02645 [Cryptomeria japonica]|uniref:putative UPF0481 protein At3g02645 n=1 Tax=Cryptomeria japonica TaxID=3369 RepID=UPI0027D9DEAD|nr:putative UPF0481 protein At3g02645 [Cryptomeria japonica]
MFAADRVETSNFIIMNGNIDINEETHTAEGNGQYSGSTGSTESWLDQVKRKSGSGDNKWQVSKNVCIYRVPKPMRTSQDDVYDPFVVSFGPFHDKMNPTLSIMDEHKIEALRITSERLGMEAKQFTKWIETEFEARIRECYAEPIEWDRETFSWAFAMDACFILEFLKGATRTGKLSEMGCRFSLVFQNYCQINSMSYGIMDDIMKMENQIPLFILKSILTKEYGAEEAETQLCTMLIASNRFDGFPFRFSFASGEETPQAFEKLRSHVQKDPAHLLDLYRRVIESLLRHSGMELDSHPEPDNSDVESESDNSDAESEPGNTKCHHSCCECLIDMPRSSNDRRCIPSAELLQTAGIKFKPGQIGFLQGRFRKSILFLPQIRVNGSTETLLRNVMAYEECQRCSWHPKKAVISNFLVMLDYLIDSAKDVSVLRKGQVISSLACSDEDIAYKFNNITKGITAGTYNGFEKVMKEAREHYNRQWNVWISQLKEEHCSRPWYFIPVAAGIILLVLTFVQTVYTVKH